MNTTTTHNITTLQNQQLNNVNGGLVSATVAVCVLGAAMAGTYPVLKLTSTGHYGILTHVRKKIHIVF